MAQGLIRPAASSQLTSLMAPEMAPSTESCRAASIAGHSPLYRYCLNQVWHPVKQEISRSRTKTSLAASQGRDIGMFVWSE